MKQSLSFLLALTLAASGIGCSGSDDDDDFGGGGVTRVRADDRQLSVGEGTVLAVDFEFDRDDVFIDDDNVTVALRLPPELRYRDDTSEIDGVSTDDGVGARVTFCQDTGETFLEYDLDRFDLDDAKNPDGDADARLTLTVDAVAAGSSVEIEAIADSNGVAYSCGGRFLSDESEFVSISE